MNRFVEDMSGTLDVRSCPMIRWNVDLRSMDHVFQSQRFHFRRAEYSLDCYRSPRDVCLYLTPKNVATNITSLPCSVTVHAEDRSTGQIFPPVCVIVPCPNVTTLLWKKITSFIERELPGPNSHELMFIVTFHTENLVTDENSVQTSMCTDPTRCSESLSEDFEKLLEVDSGSKPDVEFQCEGKSEKAHRLVLTARSQVLATMLYNQWVKGEAAVIKIEDMKFDTLKLFVRYLYTGRLEEAMTFELAMVIYEAADKYHVQSLARRCAQFLIESLTVENVFEVIDVADRHSDEKFVEEVIVFILEKRVPSTSKHWPAFCSRHPFLGTVVLNRYVEQQNRYIEELTGASGPSRKKLCTNV